MNLADLERKEKGFLLDAPVSPSELFGTSVDTVVEKFREARLLEPSFREGPGLSPNRAGVLARPGLRIGDGHRGLVSRLVPLPRLG